MPKTLLLADDSITIQRVIELTFAHEDVRVVSVGDGRRAVQWMDAEAPDIVLVDAEVPEVDGYAVLRYVKQSPRLKGVPVLVLAGAFEPIDQDRLNAIGCDGVLVKPFEPQQLVSRVKALLDQAGGSINGTGSAGARELPRGGHEDVANVTPFPAPARPVMMEARAAEPQPLEPPTRPVWQVAPTSPVTGEKLDPHAVPRVSLASAFSALLAAEQSAQPAASAAHGPISDATVEDAVRRVLVRMTDDLVRRIVVETAERMIREEIEKIKANPE